MDNKTIGLIALVGTVVLILLICQKSSTTEGFNGAHGGWPWTYEPRLYDYQTRRERVPSGHGCVSDWGINDTSLSRSGYPRTPLKVANRELDPAWGHA